ncbi:hypothetical protein BGLA2_80036 [Burkholderia gladioli]|nr:hypothetical protein BGLA2_80036 [Burkholderia gladioli]
MAPGWRRPVARPPWPGWPAAPAARAAGRARAGARSDGIGSWLVSSMRLANAGRPTGGAAPVGSAGRDRGLQRRRAGRAFVGPGRRQLRQRQRVRDRLVGEERDQVRPELRPRDIVEIDHVAALVEGHLQVRVQARHRLQPRELVLGQEERRGQVVIAVGRQHLQLRVELQRREQVRDRVRHRLARVAEVPGADDVVVEGGVGRVRRLEAELVGQLRGQRIGEGLGDQDVGGIRILLQARVAARQDHAAVITADGRARYQVGAVVVVAEVGVQRGDRHVGLRRPLRQGVVVGEGRVRHQRAAGEKEGRRVGGQLRILRGHEVLDLQRELAVAGRRRRDLVEVGRHLGITEEVADHAVGRVLQLQRVVGRVAVGDRVGFARIREVVEDRGLQHDAGQVHAGRFDRQREHVGARRAVGLAVQVERRTRAIVHRDVAADEVAHHAHVRVRAPEGLVGVRRDRFRETGAGRVDEHHVGGADQALVVAHQREVRPVRHQRIGRGHAGRRERAEPQPDRGGAGSAVVEEGDRARLAVLARRRVGDVGHARLGLAARIDRGEVAGGGGVADGLAAARPLAMHDGCRFVDLRGLQVRAGAGGVRGVVGEGMVRRGVDRGGAAAGAVAAARAQRERRHRQDDPSDLPNRTLRSAPQTLVSLFHSCFLFLSIYLNQSGW